MANQESVAQQIIKFEKLVRLIISDWYIRKREILLFNDLSKVENSISSHLIGSINHNKYEGLDGIQASKDHIYEYYGLN